MKAEQLESEQAFIGSLQTNAETAVRLQQERDAYRDALEKIQATISENLFFPDKLGRIDEITHKTLEMWK